MAEEERPVIEYDPEADILTINIRQGRRIKEDRLLDNDIVVSIDDEGELVQIQVLEASRRGLLQALLELYRSHRALLQLLEPGRQEQATTA